jgi:hypothetical protein
LTLGDDGSVAADDGGTDLGAPEIQGEDCPVDICLGRHQVGNPGHARHGTGVRSDIADRPLMGQAPAACYQRVGVVEQARRAAMAG